MSEVSRPGAEQSTRIARINGTPVSTGVYLGKIDSGCNAPDGDWQLFLDQASCGLDRFYAADASTRVAVPRNEYDAAGDPTGRTLGYDYDWVIAGRGERDGESITVVAGNDMKGNRVLSKQIPTEKLDAMQIDFIRNAEPYIQRHPDEWDYADDVATLQQLKSMAIEALKDPNLSDYQRRQIVEVLTKGTIDGGVVGWPRLSEGPGDDARVRMQFAAMSERSDAAARTAEVFAKRGVAGLHFTTSAALDGIIRSRELMSVHRMLQSGTKIVSGEHVFDDSKEGRADISFGSFDKLRDLIRTYGNQKEVRTVTNEEAIKLLNHQAHQVLRLLGVVKGGIKQHAFQRAANSLLDPIDMIRRDPDSTFAFLNRNHFSVAFGISTDYVKKVGCDYVSSSFGEFRPRSSSIDLSRLPVIAVPGSMISLVRELMNTQGIPSGENTIVPYEHLCDAA